MLIARAAVHFEARHNSHSCRPYGQDSIYSHVNHDRKVGGAYLACQRSRQTLGTLRVVDSRHVASNEEFGAEIAS